MERENRVYLVRHGQIKGYENFPVYGQTDVDLTEIGVLQMKQMAERLSLTEPKAIYSSDLKRSATGARLIARYHDVPLYFLPELRELDFGGWEGLTLSEIRRNFPEELQKREKDLINYKAPGGGGSLFLICQRESKPSLSVSVLNKRATTSSLQPMERSTGLSFARPSVWILAGCSISTRVMVALTSLTIFLNPR